MTIPTMMHPDEVATDPGLVRRLLEQQFPGLAGLRIEPVESSGTDNAIYRVGDSLAVRLPRIESAVAQVEKEHRWLPRLAPRLPLRIPVPVGRGRPAAGYPWPWSVYPWIEGQDAQLARLGDLTATARELARFVAALRGIDPRGGPAAGPHNFGRGLPLRSRDAETRAAIASLRPRLDADAALAVWDAALDAPPWDGPPLWVHGDLAPGNLIADRGRMWAVIDFGGLAVGDPACDVLPAWNLLSGESRSAFREAAGVDDATWVRGRGWALSVSVIFIPYYADTNPVGVAIAWRTIEEVLADAAKERRPQRGG